MRLLGINHQSPLIHLLIPGYFETIAGNQSPIPFDTLTIHERGHDERWESITNPL